MEWCPFSRPLHVAVLAGGPSTEREISLQSGETVTRALRATGHTVTEIDPSPGSFDSSQLATCDVAFLCLHGSFGEDGAIQQLLDAIGIPYTGSSAEASRLAFSKVLSKQAFVDADVPTPGWELLTTRPSTMALNAMMSRLVFPVVVKPDKQGSSLGVSLVRRKTDLGPAIDIAMEFGDEVLVEEAVLGPEWTVPLLDGNVLPPIQISTDRPFFDFHAKYVDDHTRYGFHADGTPTALHDAARRACEALKTNGIARVDIRLDDQARPWVLEVNTIPGMTSHSLVPKSAARLGWTMQELCERAIESAFASHSLPVPQSRYESQGPTDVVSHS